MPDERLQRTRATLPNGYQFGDSAYVDGWTIRDPRTGLSATGRTETEARRALERKLVAHTQSVDDID